MRLLEALKAGSPVEVGSADLMIAMMHGEPDYRLFVIQSALTSWWSAPLCSSERQR